MQPPRFLGVEADVARGVGDLAARLLVRFAALLGGVQVARGATAPRLVGGREALFGALRGNADATNAFLSAITGAIPLREFMSNENLGRIMAAAKD